jgi:hypothetical protein
MNSSNPVSNYLHRFSIFQGGMPRGKDQVFIMLMSFHHIKNLETLKIHTAISRNTPWDQPPEEDLKQLDQFEIIKNLDQANAPEWHEAIFKANIDIFEMSCEESISYFKRLENLEKIRRTKHPNHSSQPVHNKKPITSRVGKSSKNHKGSNMWCHYCDKNNHNTADCRAI